MEAMQRFILLEDSTPLETEEVVEFRLLYEGPLKSTQRDPAPGTNQLASHWDLKHEMRKAFDEQLRTVWSTHPVLLEKRKEDGSILNESDLAASYRIPPWSFLPLVTEKLEVSCSIEITLLRRDHPSESGWSGDIDNRVKTLIDALRVPNANDGYGDKIKYEPMYDPLHVLMSEDRLITSLAVNTGRLLKTPPVGSDNSYAHLSAFVRIIPERVTMLNLGL